MKRLLWIPLLFLYSTLWAADVPALCMSDPPSVCGKEPVQIARINPYIAGAGGAAAALSCSQWSGQLQESQDSTHFGSTYFSQKIKHTTGTVSVCQVDLMVLSAGATDTATVKLCTSNDCTTGCGDASNATDVFTGGTKYAWKSFTWASNPSMNGDRFICFFPSVTGVRWGSKENVDGGAAYEDTNYAAFQVSGIYNSGKDDFAFRVFILQ